MEKSREQELEQTGPNSPQPSQDRPAVRAILTRSDELAQARAASMAASLTMAEPGSPRRKLWDALAGGEQASKAFDRHEAGLGWRLTEEQRQTLVDFATRSRSLTLPSFKPLNETKVTFVGKALPGQDPEGPFNLIQRKQVDGARSAINQDLRRTAADLADLAQKGLKDTEIYHDAERRHKALLEKVLTPDMVQEMALARAEAWDRLTDPRAKAVSPEYQAYLKDIATGSGPAGVRPALGGHFAGWQRDEDVPLAPKEASKHALTADPNFQAEYHQGIVSGRLMAPADLQKAKQAIDQAHLTQLAQAMPPGGSLTVLAGTQKAAHQAGQAPSQGGGTAIPPGAGGPASSGPTPGGPFDILDRSVVLTPESASLARLKEDLERVQAETRKHLVSHGILTGAKLGLGVVWGAVELTAMSQGKGRDPATLMMLGANNILNEGGEFVRHQVHERNRRDHLVQEAVGRMEAEQRQVVESWREETRNQLEHLRALPVQASALEALESAMLDERKRDDHGEFAIWKTKNRPEILESLGHQMTQQQDDAVVKAGTRLLAFVDANRTTLRSPVDPAKLNDALREAMEPRGAKVSGFVLPTTLGDSVVRLTRWGGTERSRGYSAFLHNLDGMESYLKEAHAKTAVEQEIRAALAKPHDRPGGILDLSSRALAHRPGDRKLFESAVAELGRTNPGGDLSPVLSQAFEKKWAVEMDMSQGFVRMANNAPTHAQLVVEAGVTPVALLKGAYGRTIPVPDQDVELANQLRDVLRHPNSKDLRPDGWAAGTLGGGRIGLAPMPGGQTMAILTGYDPQGKYAGSKVLVLPGRDALQNILQSSTAMVQLRNSAVVLDVDPSMVKKNPTKLSAELREEINPALRNKKMVEVTPQLSRELAVQLLAVKEPSGLAQAERLPGVFTYPRGRTVLDPRPEARLAGDLDQAMNRAKLQFGSAGAEILRGKAMDAFKDDRIIGPNWVGIRSGHASSSTRVATVEQGMPTTVAGHSAALSFMKRHDPVPAPRP